MSLLSLRAKYATDAHNARVEVNSDDIDKANAIENLAKIYTDNLNNIKTHLHEIRIVQESKSPTEIGEGAKDALGQLATSFYKASGTIEADYKKIIDLLKEFGTTERLAKLIKLISSSSKELIDKLTDTADFFKEFKDPNFLTDFGKYLDEIIKKIDSLNDNILRKALITNFVNQDVKGED